MMSMAPNPGKILEMLRALEEDFHTRSTADSLLEQAVLRLLDVWPLIELARVYAPAGESLRLVAATDHHASATLAPLDTFQQAMSSGSPVWDAERRLWGVPLAAGEVSFGLLAVRLREDAAEANEWLQMLAALLTRVLAGQHTQAAAQAAREIAENLVVSSRLITTAETYEEMAQAVIYTIARDMAGVAITLFNVPFGAIRRSGQRAVVALGLPDGPALVEDVVYVDQMPDQAALENLWRGQPILIELTAEAGLALTAQYYAQATNHAAPQWLALFGLRAGDQLLGTLEILHSTVYQFSSDEIDAYITLADQIGVAARNRQLLEQTTHSLAETRRLYELNRELIAAQDVLELLRAVHALTPDAVLTVHSTFQYDSQQNLTDIVFRHIITPHDERVVEQSMLAEMGPQAVEQAQALIGLWNDPIFVEDTLHPPVEAPGIIVERMRQQGVGSVVALPIRERDQLTDIVRVGFAQPRQFDEGSRRLYAAVRDQMSIVLQTLRLLQETQQSAAALSQQVSVLQTLNDLSTVLSMARDESQLLNQSVQALVTALNIDHGQVVMLDTNQTGWVVVTEYPHRGRVGSRITFDQAPVSLTPDIESPTPLVINDVATDARVAPGARPMLEAAGVRGLMLLPMFVRGQFTGGIQLDITREGRSFTRDMVEIAQTILAQLSVGLQNIRLLAEAQRRSEQLQRVNIFGQTLQSTLDLYAILETALTETHRIIPADRMTIALHDPAADLLRTAALYANGENYLTPNNGAPVQLQGSFVGRVWENQQLLHIPDMMREQGVAADDVRELRTLLVMPLTGRDQPLGVVSVGHGQPAIYSDTDIIVFQQMMGLLAAAVENAGIFASSQRQARNEALVNEISTRLQQQVELEDMLHIAVNDLGKALGARKARIRLGTRVTE